MSTTVTLSCPELNVVPGALHECSFIVHNAGTVVEGYRLTIVGEAAEWAKVTPASFTLMPKEHQKGTIALRPPRGPKPAAGPLPFGLRVKPTDAIHDQVVEEAVLNIQPFDEWQAELVPGTQTGRRGARFVVKVSSDGNRPLRARIQPSSDTGGVHFKVNRPEIVLFPGSTSVTAVRVTASQVSWIGTPGQLPFRVAVNAADESRALEGRLLQRTIAPRWLPKAAAAGVALALGAALYASKAAHAVDATIPAGAIPRPPATTTKPLAPPTTKSNPSTSSQPSGSTTTTTSTSTTTSTTTTIPPRASGAACTSYTPAQAVASPQGTSGPWLVLSTLSFQDKTVADAVGTIAKNFNQICTLTADTTSEDGMSYWLPTPVTDYPVPSAAQCLSYNPSALTVNPDRIEAKAYDIAFGGDPSQMLTFSSQTVEQQAMAVITKYSRVCWLGGNSDGSTDSSIFDQYFDWQQAVEFWEP
jgi:hypothetical protein